MKPNIYQISTFLLFQLVFSFSVSAQQTEKKAENPPNTGMSVPKRTHEKLDENSKRKMLAEQMNFNPLLANWEGPNGGMPNFKGVQINHFVSAFEEAMEAKRVEIQQIVNNPSPPSFENTIVALEKCGQLYDRVKAVYDVWTANLNSPDFAKVEAELEPKLAAFKDEMYQNEGLFKRIAMVHEAPETKKLNAEQQRLVGRRYKTFVYNGAKLSDQAKSKVSELNQALAAIYAKFSQNLLADENEKYLELTSKEELAGLPQSLIDVASELAKEKQSKYSWIIANTRSSIDPFLTFSENRELREKAWKMFINRGDNGDKNDNNELIPKILALRAERAKLYGFETHAHWRLSNTMAKTPEKAMQLMESVWKPALLLVQKEVAEMQAIANAEGKNITIEPWDYRYYAEKVRKQKYSLDQNEVKAYLQLDKLKEGMFYTAGKLFNLNFTQIKDVDVWHPDMEVWKVSDKTTGKHVGLWYFDPYARIGKRSGAWMNSLHDQNTLDGKFVGAIVSNNSNFLKGNPGEPVLISWDDAETLFHEFGHALHGLCSKVTYPTLSGTNVPQDYVEFPSQVMERWLSTSEILQKFALHYKTNKPIPTALVEKIKKAATFNQGFQTVEATASALVDMKLHLKGEEAINADEFEKETLAALNMPKEIVMRHRTPQFGHIFSGDEYSAGYYSYLWSDVISADAWEAFAQSPAGPFDPVLASKFLAHVFSIGNTVDPEEAYKKFRGREPKTEALMKSRGL